MKIMFLAVFASALAFGQSQAGSVEIAGAVEPTVSTAFEGHARCVADLVKVGASIKDALKSCENVVKRITRTAEGMANSSQKAAQASRPIVMTSWGGGYGGRYGGYGYSGSAQRMIISAQNAEARRELSEQNAQIRRAQSKKNAEARRELSAKNAELRKALADRARQF